MILRLTPCSGLLNLDNRTIAHPISVVCIATRFKSRSPCGLTGEWAIGDHPKALRSATNLKCCASRPCSGEWSVSEDAANTASHGSFHRSHALRGDASRGALRYAFLGDAGASWEAFPRFSLGTIKTSVQCQYVFLKSRDGQLIATTCDEAVQRPQSPGSDDSC
jgi:hypothetical protein